MTLQFTLPPHLEQRLHDEADRRGLSPEAYTVQLLEQQLPPAATPVAADSTAEERLQTATTIQAWVAAANALPEDDDDDDYDLCAALNANREASGERLLFPPELKGVTW
jgi:hypothetical protein